MIFYIPWAKSLQCDHSNESPKSKKFQRFLQIAKQLVRCEVKTKTDLGWGQKQTPAADTIFQKFSTLLHRFGFFLRLLIICDMS